MDNFELLGRLGLSFGIGLLFGIERGWQERDASDGSRTAGIRTFTLMAVFGGVWGAMVPVVGPVPLSVAGFALAAAFTLFYWGEMMERKEYSVTNVVAALLAFALGALAVLGSSTVAAAVAIACVGVLSARQRMHEFIANLTWLELRSALLLLAMSFVALPLLPDRTIDPWDSVNPHDLWLMIVLIAAVAFAGYVAVRLLGERRGLLVSSAAGALISSTTVTINNSRFARGGSGQDNDVLAAAVCVAWIVSFVRMTAVASIVNAEMLKPLAFPILAAVAVLILAVLYFVRISAKDGHGMPHGFENPLDFGFVLKLGVLLAIVTVAANIASSNFGQEGVLGLAGISGFVDVDPITLSVSRKAGNAMMYADAAQAIFLAAAANMVTKMSATVVLGGLKFGFKLVAAGVLALIAGGSVLVAYGV